SETAGASLPVARSCVCHHRTPTAATHPAPRMSSATPTAMRRNRPMYQNDSNRRFHTWLPRELQNRNARPLNAVIRSSANVDRGKWAGRAAEGPRRRDDRDADEDVGAPPVGLPAPRMEEVPREEVVAVALARRARRARARRLTERLVTHVRRELQGHEQGQQP